MAWTIECQRGEDVLLDCCGSGTGITEAFTGLLVTETGGAQTRLRRPFQVFTGSNYAYVHDHHGAYKKILLSDTAYATVAELKLTMLSCGVGRIIRQVFSGATGTSVTVTENGGVLPDDTDQIVVTYNGQTMTPTADYTVTAPDIDFTFEIDGVVQVMFISPNG